MLPVLWSKRRSKRHWWGSYLSLRRGSPPRTTTFLVAASSPHGFTLPPCNPVDNNGSPKPEIGMVQKLWCVAKPSVPAETLQEAMDYACGAGGADCEEISPQGNCYNPDT